jgi:hypothetical protein
MSKMSKMSKMLQLMKTKTFWVGISALALGLGQGFVDGDWSVGSDKILFGLACITGRDALLKLLTNDDAFGDPLGQ